MTKISDLQYSMYIWFYYVAMDDPVKELQIIYLKRVIQFHLMKNYWKIFYSVKKLGIAK